MTGIIEALKKTVGEAHVLTDDLGPYANDWRKKYYGKPINFVLHKNSELGLEKDYFAFMNQGISVDYGIVSPAHMSTFAKAAPFIDAPFLFRDVDHWNKVIDADTLKPIADWHNPWVLPVYLLLGLYSGALWLWALADLAGAGARWSRGQLRLRIVDAQRLNPDTIMPAYHRTAGLHRVAPALAGTPLLGAQQIEDVVAYLETLQ